MSLVINSWRKGELKTPEEENRNLMEEAGLIEAKHTKSPTMEEEKHEKENVDEDEYEGNDEEETLLNEDEKEEVEQAMKAYLESKRTNEEESVGAENEDTEDEDNGLVDDNILSTKLFMTRMTYDDIVNSTDPSIRRCIFIKLGEINNEGADVSPLSVNKFYSKCNNFHH